MRKNREINLGGGAGDHQAPESTGFDLHDAAVKVHERSLHDGRGTK